MNVAYDIAKRSACVRAHVGAVIITPDNRMAGLGYNGPPRNFPATCAQVCPRALDGPTVNGYDTCIATHAEANAIMHASWADRQDSTMYVTGVVCLDCAKLTANSGVKTVIMRVAGGDAHRQPDRTIAFLQACNITVQVWDSGYAAHRQAFFQVYGPGPHNCYFCEGMLAYVEVVHHVDHNHANNDPVNLRAAHNGCHSSYHNTRLAKRERSRDEIEKVHGPQVKCPVCDKISTRAGMGRHRAAKGH